MRLLIGLLLIPVCVAATETLMALSAAVRPESKAFIPPSTLALGGGYALWLIAYYTLPKPVRTYVLAHELTHALWGMLMGAQVSRLSVSKKGGSVTLSKNNFLITLAPYFFPLYTVLVVVAYYVTGVFLDVSRWYLLWLGLVGFTWGFHFTFTISTLMQHQSDIQLYGRVFSYTIIYLFNVIGVCFWVVLVSSPHLADFWEIGSFYVREMSFAALRGAQTVFAWASQYLARFAR
ncbi:MAG: M50 family metallopeptidase [Verrucomicrobia bacterium]|nr:M50 family metallopeptidase [Verrucomicrobiota bacterium]